MAVMSGELNNLKTALNPLKTALNTSQVEGSRGFQDALYFFIYRNYNLPGVEENGMVPFY
jgi:hypothetical protein